MGAPNEAYQYPNVQQKLMPPDKLFAHVEQKPNKTKELINFIGDQFGWAWVATFLSIGAVMVATFVFKTQIKKRFGEALKWASDIVNK